MSYQGLMYDDTVIDYFDADQAIGVIDTGTSMMAMPHKYYQRLVQAWSKQIDNPVLLDCSMGLCIGGLSCEHIAPKLSNLTIKINDHFFDIMPQGFLINATDLGVEPEFENKCIFGVIPLPEIVGDSLMFLLGDVFLRNFYSVFDYDNQLVYLAVNKHSEEYVSITRPSHVHLYLGSYGFALMASVLLFRVISTRLNRDMRVKLSSYQTKMLTAAIHPAGLGGEEQTPLPNSDKGSVGGAPNAGKQISKSVPGERQESLLTDNGYPGAY